MYLETEIFSNIHSGLYFRYFISYSRKFEKFHWLNLELKTFLGLQCFVLVFDGLCGSSSITAAAKHANHERKNLDDEAHLRLLSYLDNENKISLESLEHLSPAKLIGRDKSSEEDSSNDHSNDMDSINKLLMMDDPVSSSDKSAPGIGKKF